MTKYCAACENPTSNIKHDWCKRCFAQLEIYRYSSYAKYPQYLKDMCNQQRREERLAQPKKFSERNLRAVAKANESREVAAQNAREELSRLGFDDLSGEDRAILLLPYRGHSAAAIATILGISTDRFYRRKRKLMKLIYDRGTPELLSGVETQLKRFPAYNKLSRRDQCILRGRDCGHSVDEICAALSISLEEYRKRWWQLWRRHMAPVIGVKIPVKKRGERVLKLVAKSAKKTPRDVHC